MWINCVVPDTKHHANAAAIKFLTAGRAVSIDHTHAKQHKPSRLSCLAHPENAKEAVTLLDNLVLQVRVLRPESFWYRETGKVVSVDQVSMIQFSNVSAFHIGQIRLLASSLTHPAWACVLLHFQLLQPAQSVVRYKTVNLIALLG